MRCPYCGQSINGHGSHRLVLPYEDIPCVYACRRDEVYVGSWPEDDADVWGDDEVSDAE